MRLTGFDGKTALVTGAAGGIGRAVVAALTEAGANVLASDRAEAITADCREGARLRWRAFDVAEDDADALVAEASASFGPVTLGVHAAGILSVGSLLDCATAEWDRVMAVNAGGTFRVITALGREMRHHGGGAIAVVGSNAGGIPRIGMGAYAASKAAAAMLTRCLGLELAAQNIRCNIVAPGSTLTPMQTGMWDGPEGQEKVIAGDLATYRTGIPLGKLAVPEDIAASVLYLLSDQAGHITMSDLYVDGGATLRA
ncbi:SDR family oxidoreductase [Paracoccus sulfuroxidans]|uniref:2,3-dihydro-2,3-dihydroxybenzoate dehydrogenase n=1 Tax=Paracoccus sulfuroxidans TaxID=384678 RepID=A0A562NGF2_9RHOB|nr:SDR family oxidoreductase [Paracoccus sulfuroxidans]TWI31272.1 2,3-dihydro-2,3-dihydroxybenzoate dehydrogenase [Paracoccus sulfuroxidans]